MFFPEWKKNERIWISYGGQRYNGKRRYPDYFNDAFIDFQSRIEYRNTWMHILSNFYATAPLEPVYTIMIPLRNYCYLYIKGIPKSIYYKLAQNNDNYIISLCVDTESFVTNHAIAEQIIKEMNKNFLVTLTFRMPSMDASIDFELSQETNQLKIVADMINMIQNTFPFILRTINDTAVKLSSSII